MNRKIPRLLLLNVSLIFIAALTVSGAQQKKAAAPKALRLYILDCGKITGVGEAAFGFQPGQLANTEMFTPCFLIAHPRGTMIWDTGEIADAQFKAPGPATQGAFTVAKPLLPQLAEIGYTPGDITYLALSHYHGDHVANAHLFARSTWIVQKIERDAMSYQPIQEKPISSMVRPVPAPIQFFGSGLNLLLMVLSHQLMTCSNVPAGTIGAALGS
jgi:hypothetical protein